MFVTSGVAVDFNYLVAPDDRIAVYPEGHNQDIGALHPLRPPSPARFILDNHLGSLARYMRLVGLDTRYPVEHLADAQLAEIATDIVDQLEPKTRKYYNEFHRCRGCDQIYWKGSHFEKLERVMDALLQNS